MRKAFREYVKYDATGLAELVRRGEVHPGELVEAAIERVERDNPRLNAVIHKMYEKARQAAEGEVGSGRFAGVPYLAKDGGSTWEGEPQGGGSKYLSGFVAPHDGELTKRVRRAGLIAVGKTNLPEFGLLPVTEPKAFGATRNPWNLDRTPGGSSGGSAAAVAAGMVPMAGGNDGGGSIRIPASCSGLFGLKPTRGRTPLGPDVAELWQGNAVEHVLTRSVRDSAAMLDAIAGVDAGAPYDAPAPARPFIEEVGAKPGKLRIGFTTKALLPARRVDGECVRAVENTAALLRELGHEVVEEVPAFDGEQFSIDFVHMLVGETSSDVKEAAALLGRAPRRGELEPETELLAMLGEAVSAAEYSLALRRLRRVGRVLAPYFERHDLLMTPVLALPPVRVGELMPTGVEKAFVEMAARLRPGRLIHKLGGLHRIAANAWNFAAYTAPFNCSGQPAMSVPLHWSPDGLPIGVHFAARLGDEATLLRLAAQLEEARPWANRRPPGFA